MKRSVHRLRVPVDVAAFVRGLHPDLKRKLRVALEVILAQPHIGKALRDELSGLHSLRVGRFRVVYRIAGNRIIELVAVGPRENIYEETYRRIRRTPAEQKE